MTSSNLKKVMQNNLYISPSMLSKNTNKIVNSCIKKIYEQMPHSFNKDLKTIKVASKRPENMAPIRLFKCQQSAEKKPAKIMPIFYNYPNKKSSRSNLAKLSQERLMHFFNIGNDHNMQVKKKSSAAVVGSLKNRQLLKTPNFKIYGSRSFRSSASSSRSSLVRRYDERRRQKQQVKYSSNLNGSVRQFDDNIAKTLMPKRNQQVNGHLGSLPQAMEVSSSIQNDLMLIDDVIRNRISLRNDKQDVKNKKLDTAFKVDHPLALDKLSFNTLTKLLAKSNKPIKRSVTKHSPEHREFARYAVNPLMQFSHSQPPTEFFIAQHERSNTELQEKHRRNRMKKLGLIKESPRPSKTGINQCLETEFFQSSKPFEKDLRQHYTTNSQTAQVEPSDVGHCCYSKSSNLPSQLEACRKLCELECEPATAKNFPIVRKKVSKCNTSARSKKVYSSLCSLTSKSTSKASTNYKQKGPLAMATLNFKPTYFVNTNLAYGGYRLNRSSYFPLRKY